jgi:hypothetical protein
MTPMFAAPTISAITKYEAATVIIKGSHPMVATLGKLMKTKRKLWKIVRQNGIFRISPDAVPLSLMLLTHHSHTGLKHVRS